MSASHAGGLGVLEEKTLTESTDYFPCRGPAIFPAAAAACLMNGGSTRGYPGARGRWWPCLALPSIL